MARKGMWTAGAFAGVGALSLHGYLLRFEAEAAGGAPQPIVTLATDLSPGELITQAALTERELPEQYVEERHIPAADRGRVVGLRATTLLRGGNALLWTDLDVMQEGRALSSLVRTGMRAFAIPSAEASFDGLLRPGDRVDVILAPGGDHAQATRTLLQNVLVLTVGGDLGKAATRSVAGPYEPSSGVTLSVSPEQAEALAHAEGQGRLRLSLRNPEDLLTQERALPPSGTALSAAEVAHAR